MMTYVPINEDPFLVGQGPVCIVWDQWPLCGWSVAALDTCAGGGSEEPPGNPLRQEAGEGEEQGATQPAGTG